MKLCVILDVIPVLCADRRWRQVSQKAYLCTKLHCVTSQKISVDLFFIVYL
jgi:hypothetical protein